jgi:head-tail adaptor
MNRPVTLAQSPVTTDDADGFFEPLTPSNWWAAIQPLPPATAGDGTRVIASLVTMRYHPQVTVDTRVRYGTRDLFVKGVQNVNEEDREMVLYCEEVIP